MKRSEMLLAIYGLLHRGPDYPTEEEILNLVEDLGMLAPGYMKPIEIFSDGKQYPLIPGDFKNEAGVWCTPGVNEWESE